MISRVSLTKPAPNNVPAVAQSDRSAMDATQSSSSVSGGGTATKAADDTVAKRKGHTSRGRDRFMNLAMTKTATVTSAL